MTQGDGFEQALAGGGAELTLDPDDNRARLAIDAWATIERYHDLALGGRDVDVGVADQFRLAVTPVLGETERESLPAHAARNLALGQSALTDRATTEFEMRFRIGRPRYELLDQR